MSEPTDNSELKRPPPARRSDVIEGQWEKAITWAVFGVLALIIGLLLFFYNENWFAVEKLNFEGLNIRAISYPFLALGALLMLYSASRVMGGKKVKSYLSTCPYCGHDSEFAEEPNSDFICEECARRVPVKDGKVLDVTGVRCGFCGALNFMSEKTKVLICEECDREIPLLDPNTGEMRHVAKGYARVDDSALYDLVLVKVGRDKEPLINSLQHILAMTRNQVKDMLDSLPTTLMSGINRRKAEMLRAQIEVNEGETEMRVSDKRPS
jgi:hypothetical protein